MMAVATMLASKQSITLPFYPVKLKTANFSRRILPVYERVECAFFYLRKKSVKGTEQNYESKETIF